MEQNLYNQKGEKIGKVDLPERIFDAKVNSDLLHQAVLYYEDLKRQPIAKVKDRSEVRGGGKKPWKQKGTGRARHGSIRSPLWRHGGVTFGPNPEKKYQTELPKKMRRSSVSMALSSKLKDGEIIFLDKIEISESKTKKIREILSNLSKIKKDIGEKKTALILEKKNDILLKAAKNIRNISTIPAGALNSYFLLANKYLVIEKAAINKFKVNSPIKRPKGEK